MYGTLPLIANDTMGHIMKRAATAALLLLSSLVNSQDPTECANILKPTYSAPVAAKGWKAQLIATGLSKPRGIKFDSNGALLVVEVGVGITYLNLTDNGGTCLFVANNRTLVSNDALVSLKSFSSTRS